MSFVRLSQSNGDTRTVARSRMRQHPLRHWGGSCRRQRPARSELWLSCRSEVSAAARRREAGELRRESYPLSPPQSDRKDLYFGGLGASDQSLSYLDGTLPGECVPASAPRF